MSWAIGLVLISVPMPYTFSSIALAVIGAVALMGMGHRQIHWRPSYLWPMLLFGLIVLSLFWTQDLGKSLRGIGRQLPLLVMPLSFLFWPKFDQKVWHKGVFIGGLAGALLALFAVARAALRSVGQGDYSPFFYHELVDFWELNAIYVSAVSATYVLFFWLVYAPEKGRSRRALILGGIHLGFLILLSSKNIILTTLLIGFVAKTYTHRKRLKRLILIAVVCVAAVVALSQTPWGARWAQQQSTPIADAWTCEGFTDIYPWTGTTLRVFFTRVFVEQLSEDQAWLTGYGINAGQAKIAQGQNRYFVYCGYNTYNLHNQYWQTIFELGLIGGVLLVVMLLQLARAGVKRRDWFQLGFALLMVALMVTETYLWRQRGLIHFMILYLALTAAVNLNSEPLQIQSLSRRAKTNKPPQITP
jgi:O-antigen ligase